MLAMMPGEKSMVIVSLAGEALLTVAARIDVARMQWDDGLNKSKRMMVSTLAKGGDIRWLDPDELVARMASGIHEGAGQRGEDT